MVNGQSVDIVEYKCGFQLLGCLSFPQQRFKLILAAAEVSKGVGTFDHCHSTAFQAPSLSHVLWRKTVL